MAEEVKQEQEQQTLALPGVKKAELIRKVWTKWDMLIIFAGLILLSWTTTWETNLGYTMLPNVTSIFMATHITSVLSTVTYILQSVLFPTYSKLSDLIGRIEAFTIAMVFYVVSYVIMATANNFGTIVGGQVVYTFGYAGVTIIGPILVGDMTTTVQRGFYHGLYQIPQLINIFVPPIVAQSLVNQGQWRWGYGHLPIVLLVGNLPLVCGLWRTQFKVFKRGLYDEYKQAKRERDSHRSLWQSIRFYLVAIDLVGCILLVGGLTMILLPLVLALSTWGGWTNSRTLGSLCGGVVAWVLFFVWEWKFAENPLVPMMNWPNKTPLWGVCATSTVTIISSTNWQYFSSYLMVSRKIDSQTATWMQRGYNVAYLIVQLLVGYLMMWTRVWRPYVWVGIALMILGVGLMIPARLPSSSDAFVVISQAIAGVGSGMMDIPITVAIQSSVPHNDLAMVTSLYQLGGSIAASIGSTMAGAIWNQMLPGQLAKYVPGQYDQEEIMGDIFYATSLPDDQYQGVVEAYGETQKVLSIISVCISILTFAFTIPMKGFGLSDNNQKEDKPEQKESGLDENSTKNQVPVAKH